ncbi:MAG: acetyl-CoA carboxylase carboxyltransferase subunit beta [Ktedonobacterales bacterium]|nr:acetyl-CoA carboxylase carboxyltransferase subunit beta [Ktedonobacterales bacterium]
MKDESRPALAGLNGDHPDAHARALPNNVAVKCPNCRELLVGKDWEKNLKVCQRCGHHFRLGARARLDLLLDPDSFEEFAAKLQSSDPLNFVSRSQSYRTKLESERANTQLDEGTIIGRGRIEDMSLMVGVMDFGFIGGSMGAVVGEKLTRAIEMAADERLPLLIISASGGARMQEGLLSLMQMAKTSAALACLGEAGVPYISLLTDPTTGGVAASFAFLGDVILAEPGALIGFAGPRVIEQFMHQRLPKDTNTSEFVLAHGMLDGIVHRRALRPTLARLLRLYHGMKWPA